MSHSISVDTNLSGDFLQVRTQLDVTSERLSGFSEVSVSPAHAEHVLRELCAHEDKACVRYILHHPNNRGLKGPVCQKFREAWRKESTLVFVSGPEIKSTFKNNYESNVY